MSEAWKRRGLCAGGDPRDWETENLPAGQEKEAAKALCDGCPVTKECAAAAVRPFYMPGVRRDLGLGMEQIEKPYTLRISGVVVAGVPT
ncbi:WhiB family transcriptional regulator [Rhodococcus sp. NPDC019627]|uniref:WhiB family transcriptional regulator n=1 Tax=unclassified Rhodococcus (in: high G+C Gram-positive bacteria) TaxID=192944 RepID=UPI0033D913FC